jgi:hypothetical protein
VYRQDNAQPGQAFFFLRLAIVHEPGPKVIVFGNLVIRGVNRLVKCRLHFHFIFVPQISHLQTPLGVMYVNRQNDFYQF